MAQSVHLGWVRNVRLGKGQVSGKGGIPTNAPEGAGCNGPACDMGWVRKVQASAESCQMFNIDRVTFLFAEGSAFLVGRNPEHVNHVVIAMPRCMVGDVPSLQARQPALDGLTGDSAGVFSDEGRDQEIRGGHAFRFGNFFRVTELGETE